ncbi:PCI-domain-containing protein [Fistulina hepatica ATCC 64428]|uniref:Eukaryotic translation initiation factor 3 subunit M n=1 Tax=Fistulina hepatica ATCC 64428 TaxID=1128425 RepID=A0A0D7ANG3_9AGAR|nr:PCI-domain-containing protein [Fistulina hepatica ATCC 64428]
MADSVSIFSEGTFEEQILEIINYLARTWPEETRPAYVQPFADALKTPEGQKPLDEDGPRKKQVLSTVLAEVTSLGDGSDEEIEGFFNLIYSHVLSIYPSVELVDPIASLLSVVFVAPSEQSAVKYRILSNLYNVLPRTSPLRLQVYSTLLSLASSQDDLDVLQLTPSEVERQLGEWEVSTDQKSAFLELIIEAFTKTGDLASAYPFSLLHLKLFDSSSPKARQAGIDAIVLALRLPQVFDFNPLFKLDGVIAAKDHELFSLLQVFLTGSLQDYNAWMTNHAGVLEQYGLRSDDLLRKIRLLTLASLAFKSVGSNLPYAKIAEVLEITSSEVEAWVIDVIRAGLLVGKLSQTTQTLHVVRSTARVFEKEQWQILENRLVSWKSNLSSVLEVIAAARRNGGNVHVSAQTQTVTV